LSDKIKRKINIKPVDAVLEDDKEGIISKYINPDPTCPCCNLPGISVKINQSYLNGFKYKEIIEKYSEQIEKKHNRKLTVGDLSTHFTNHINHKAAAIAEFNRKHGMTNLSQDEKEEITGIAKSLAVRELGDLELFQRTVEEDVNLVIELDDIIKKRIKEGRDGNIENTMMKKHQVLADLRISFIEKAKMMQKALVQSKQMEVIDKQLQFLDVKTANVLGISSQTLSPALYKESEKLYLKIVLSSIIKRIEQCFDTLEIDQVQKTHFFRELKKEFKGIENFINEEFKKKVSNLKEVNAK